MTHERAFLQSIIEAPDDDALRLVYADWLDEHGDAARAEFIRVQCELAKRDRCAACEQFRQRVVERQVPEGATYVDSGLLCTKCRYLCRREREIVEKYGATWIAEMLKTPTGTFRRCDRKHT